MLIITLQDKDAALRDLSAAAQSMVQSGDREAGAARDKTALLVTEVERLHRVTEVRIKLCLIYVTFQRLVQQVPTSFPTLLTFH